MSPIPVHAALPGYRPPAAEASTADGRERVFLCAGQLHASARPAAITTVLGSCGCVTLYDPVARVGGMNHFLLPWSTEASEQPLRFGNLAIAHLVRKMQRLGASEKNLRANLFGGAALSPLLKQAAGLGADNVATARQLLRAAGIPIALEDVGGDRARKVIFLTDVGLTRIETVGGLDRG